MIPWKIYKRQQEAELFREKEFRAAVKIQVKLLLRNQYYIIYPSHGGVVSDYEVT